nr:putative phage tail protein [uncultured Planococcus sp.]
MFDAMPGYYRENVEAKAIVDAHADLHNRIAGDTQDVLAQFFVESATWGLAHWERIFGIPTDEAKSLGERRSAIYARMRGVGTVSKRMIKNVAESWYGGEVDVVEVPGEFRIVIRFVSSYGIPPNLGDVERALRLLMPAHLFIEFEFKYTTYNDIRAKYATYDDIIAEGINYYGLMGDSTEGAVYNTFDDLTAAGITFSQLRASGISMDSIVFTNLGGLK